MKKSLFQSRLKSLIPAALSLFALAAPAQAKVIVLATDGNTAAATVAWKTNENDCSLVPYGHENMWRNKKGRECNRPSTHLYTTEEVDALIAPLNQRLDSGVQTDQQLGAQIESLRGQLEQQNQKLARQEQLLQEQSRLIAEQNRAFFSGLDQIEERTLNSQSIKLVREQLLRELKSAKSN